jgi:rhodanese-related sulfurtransferase
VSATLPLATEEFVLTDNQFDAGLDRAIIDPHLETTVDVVAHALHAGSIQLIDVREQEEWNEERIPGSRLIPMSEFAERVCELDPAVPIVTVCRVGARSLFVAEALQEAGLPEVKSLAGGLNAWIAAGQPLEY